jgi:hypothetical protein
VLFKVGGILFKVWVKGAAVQGLENLRNVLFKLRVELGSGHVRRDLALLLELPAKLPQTSANDRGVIFSSRQGNVVGSGHGFYYRHLW